MDWFIKAASAEEAFEVAEGVEIRAAQSVVSVFFSILPLLLLLVIAAVVAVIVVILVNSGKKQQVSAQQYVPAAEIQSVHATVITKRNPNGNEYYLGFETEYGQRIEFRVSGPQYGVTLEGDKGMLKLSNNTFAGFDRA